MTLPCVIFTFELDAHLVPFSAQSALTQGLWPVFVMDDGNRPLPEGITRQLEKMGCRVRRTRFQRQSGLRGVVNFLGMLETYLWVFRRTGARHLVKLDSDTIIRDSTRLFQASWDDVAAFGPSEGDYHFLGHCYVVAHRFIAALMRFVRQWGGVPGRGSMNMCEDKAIGQMAARMGLGECRTAELNLQGGFCASYMYERAKVPLEEYARRFEVVNFGRRDLTGLQSSCSRRDKVAATMLMFTRILESHATSC